MLYDELLQEFASQAILMDDAKQKFDNTLAQLKSLKERDDLHYADYVLAVQDLGLNHNYEYIHRLIRLIEPER
jgi:hypothetical protein